MSRKLLAKFLKTGSVTFLLVLLLFDGKWQSSSGFTGLMSRGISAAFRDAQTQWMVFLCLGFYFVLFLFLRFQARLADDTADCRGTYLHRNASVLWLAGALLISAALYGLHYVPSTHALTLLAGAVVGQGMVFLFTRRQHSNTSIASVKWIPFLLVLLLALASVWKQNDSYSYTYHSQNRWIGPWGNPNIFGLLMGTGMAIAIGNMIAGWRVKNRQWQGMLCVVLCVFAAILMGRGWWHSYSRGAWFATLCGLVWLAFQWFKAQSSDFSRRSVATTHPAVASRSWIGWLARNRVSLSVVLLSMFILCCWRFKHSKSEVVADRIASAANENDFSWRNRVAAWEGALQIVAEHPWFGAGWSQPEPLYEHYYLPPQLTESAAIEMNDYLMMGATLGIPALFCFGMYLWLSLRRKSESGNLKVEIREMDWLTTTCRAGAIVLAIGFWFDGGLFKLATASTFWILLELGNVQTTNGHEFTPMKENLNATT